MNVKRILLNAALVIGVIVLIVGVIVGLFCIVHSVIAFDFGLLFIGLAVAGVSYGLLQALVYFTVLHAFDG